MIVFIPLPNVYCSNYLIYESTNQGVYPSEPVARLAAPCLGVHIAPVLRVLVDSPARRVQVFAVDVTVRPPYPLVRVRAFPGHYGYSRIGCCCWGP